MKKLTILGIIACVGLLFGPAAVLGAGPPGGLDVNVVKSVPLQVTGEVDANVIGDVNANVVNEPGVTVLNDDTNPVPVAVQSGGPPAYRFVGVTATSTTGIGPGPIGMNSICENEFSNGARMCTTKEFIDSGETGILAAPGWINTSLAALNIIERSPGVFKIIIATTSGLLTSFDVGGINEIGFGWNCQNWQNEASDNFGTVLTREGALGLLECSRELGVICCAPTIPSP